MPKGVYESVKRPMECKYSHGYGGEITIWVTDIIPSEWVTEQYLELVTENETYPATWLEFEQGVLVAGCSENF